jgi:hypothetical protein
MTVFENRALRRIFGPKRDEVTGERRRLHNEELHRLLSSPIIILCYIIYIYIYILYRVLVGKPEGKRPRGRPRLRWEENIKMDIQEVKWSMVWLKIGTDGGLL